MVDTFLWDAYSRIENSLLYKKLKERESILLEQVNRMVRFITPLYAKIENVFSDYTEHGIDHVCNVMNYIAELVYDSNKVSDLEILCMIYASLLHDIGMIVSNDEIEKVKENSLEDIEFKFEAVLKECNQDEHTALQECFRPVHGIRSAKMIRNEKIGESSFPDNVFYLTKANIISNITFKKELANICQAHNEDFEWIERNIDVMYKKGNYSLNARYIAVLLRIADSLDIDENRAPYSLYQYIEPKDFGKEEWQQHFVIENTNKIVLDKQTGRRYIEFCGSCDNPRQYEKLMRYIVSLEKEVIKCNKLIRDKENDLDIYDLRLENEIRNKIERIGFSFAGKPLSLDYLKLKELLMGKNIYGDSRYGLRELLQNGIDACKVMVEKAKLVSDYEFNTYEPVVQIILNENNNTVAIIDNGCGMNEEMIWKYFLKVGQSYYTSKEFRYSFTCYKPISHYGIGFLSCFMLSDEVTVKTKYIGETVCHQIKLYSNSEFVSIIQEHADRRHGTEIILAYDRFMSSFYNSKEIIKKFIEEQFLDNGVKIEMKVISKERSDISIKLKCFNDLSGNTVNLDDYFNDIEVSIKFNYKKGDGKILFATNLSEVMENDIFFYDCLTNTVTKIDDKEDKLLKDIAVDGNIILDQVTYLYGGYQETDDFLTTLYQEGSLDSLTYNDFNYLDWDNLYIAGVTGDTAEHEIWLYSDEGWLYTKDNKDDYTYEDFCYNFGYNADVPGYSVIIEQPIILGDGDKTLLYNIKKKQIFETEQSIDIFINNIYVKYARVTIPALVGNISISKLNININNNTIHPDVSRNNISKEIEDDLGFAVGKAIHLYLYKTLDLNMEERKLFDRFMETYYNENSYLLKK